MTGKIAIGKFGNGYRGNKVRWAAAFGFVGIILYMDPGDYYKDKSVGPYPDSLWLPASGVQRGTTLNGDGDPLTPNYPSTGL